MTKTSPFADEVSEGGMLEIDKGIVERIVFPDPPFVLGFHAAGREGVECVRILLEQLAGEIVSRNEPVADEDDEGEDTFVDVVGGG